MFRARVPLLSVLLVLGFLGGFALAGRGAGGTYSLPAGNPVVSGTTITSTWANNTLSDMATGITDSLDRQGRGGMLAPLQCTSGSALAPGLTFSAEPSSGLYRQAAGDIRFAVSGTRVFSWATSGNASAVPLSVTGRTTTTNLTVTGSSEALVITPTTTNATGLYVGGNSGGAGVSAYGGYDGGHGLIGVGGAPNGSGLWAVGATTGNGITAYGGGTSGPAIDARAQGGDSRGGYFQGQGSGDGLYAIGGGDAGTGIRGVGGSTNGIGVYGEGKGTNPGVYAVGGSGGSGLYALAGTAATGATRTDAILAGNGDVCLDGVASPSSTTAVKNRLTPTNIPKAWAKVTVSGATATVNSGFNIASTSTSATNAACISAGKSDQITINFAQSFANADQAVMLQAGPTGACYPYIISQTSSSVTLGLQHIGTSGSPSYLAGPFRCTQSACGTFTDVWNWDNYSFYLVAYGEQ